MEGSLFSFILITFTFQGKNTSFQNLLEDILAAQLCYQLQDDWEVM